jgi:hypothetical protein
MKRFAQSVLVLILLLVGTAMVVRAAAFNQEKDGSASSEPAGTPEQNQSQEEISSTSLEEGFAPVYLPLIVISDPLRYQVTGTVTDANQKPVQGVSVIDGSGLTALTDENGLYVIDGLVRGEHALAPEKEGFVFSPSVLSVSVPAEAVGMDFTALTACADVVANGGFEGSSAWNFPLTPYPAGYTSAYAHGGNRSARTGILKTAENIYSYSSVQQLINIPADASSVTLRLWLYPLTEEAVSQALPAKPESGKFGLTSLSNDIQYLLILDEDGNILETLLWFRSDKQQWSLYEFNLTGYAGKRIKIHAGTFNDGSDGVTALLVDDVSVVVCPATAPTPTPTPTQTGTLPACGNLLENPTHRFPGRVLFRSVTDRVALYAHGYRELRQQPVQLLGCRAMGLDSRYFCERQARPLDLPNQLRTNHPGLAGTTAWEQVRGSLTGERCAVCLDP